MAEFVSSDDVDEDMKCGICSETFRQPKLLSCLHCFCKDCIQTYIKTNTDGGSFPCPMCSETIATPENLAEGLEDNSYIQAETLRRETKSQTKCDVCDENDASSICLECEQRYCTFCSSIHVKMKIARDHRLVCLDQQQKTEKLIPCKDYCLQHPAVELGYFCVECEKAVCYKCYMGSHQTHLSREIEEVVAEKKRELMVVIETDIEGNSVPKLRTRITTLLEQKKQVEANKGTERKRIEDYTREMKEQIDKKSNDMLVRMEQQSIERVESVEREMTSLKKAINANEKARLSARQIMEASGNCEWLKRHGDIQSKMAAQLERQKQLNYPAPAEVKRLHFIPGKLQDNAKAEDELFGRLITVEFKMTVKNVMVDSVRDTVNFGPRAICVGDEGSVWMCFSRSVKLYGGTGHPEKTVHVGEKAYDLASDDSGQIFVACETRVKTIGKERQPFHFRLPKPPSGLACCSDGSIMVGFQNPGEIIQYSRQGEVIKSIKTVRDDGHHVRPHKLAVSDVTHDLVVCDRNSDDVTVFDAAGKVKAVIKEVEMSPRDVACSCHGNILVADYNRHRVLMYSMDGLLLGTPIPSRDYGLEHPVALFLDTAGNLLVADLYGDVNYYRLANGEL